MGCAQAQPTTPVSQWGYGARLGLGSGTGQYGDYRREHEYRYPSVEIGLLATRYLANVRTSLSFEAVVQRQSVYVGQLQQPSHTELLHQWRLFMPLYLRTGTPASLLHLLVGAGPTLRLGQPDTSVPYYPYRAELKLLLGAELRLAPWHRYETTLGFRFQVPLTPSYAYGYLTSYTSQGVYVTHESRRDAYNSWFGLTLGTTLYPAARK